mmetsp:Transcript_51511/g.156087  ORF Transcript_51511/g.156087 Transcript_51511/m.156087 type:complete len:628 (+) Transcript_51511:139-2022(+)
MKVQVNVNIQSKGKVEAVVSTFDLVVAPSDTARSVKGRVLGVEPIPFPEQELVFAGRALGDAERLLDCGVKEGSSLDFAVQASAEAFAQQLLELLQAGSLPTNELGLLYCHRHGVTVGQALKLLGRESEPLHDFLKQQKGFILEDGRVSKARAESTAGTTPVLGKIQEDGPLRREQFNVAVSVMLKTPSMPDQVSSLDLVVSPVDFVRNVKQRIGIAALIPFHDRELLIGGSILEDGQNLSDCGVKEGGSLDFVVRASEEDLAQQLSELLQAGRLSLNELGMLYSTKHGATISSILKVFGWGEQLADFLGKQPCFLMQGGCVEVRGSAKSEPVTMQMLASENQRYLDLHAEISSHAFREEAAQALDRIVVAVRAATFLKVRHIVKGGSVGRGTAILGAADAEAVLFLEGLPPTGQDRWFPGLLRSTAGGLGASLAGEPGIRSVQVAGSAVRICVEGSFDVDLRFAPAVGSYRDAIGALREQPPGARAHCAAWLAEQRVRFVQKQPEAVKTTMRLLRWWREQRAWTAAVARPSDDILELVAVHAAAEAKPSDQCAAVAAAMSLLARFDELRITWPGGRRCYAEEDVPVSLMSRRPLLLDPANPFANLADPQAFDPSEMMAFVRSGSFF